jgi:hypothetical protein
MSIKSCSLILDNDLREQFDFEGLLVNSHNPQFAMLVMSSKDDTFTLHIYKLYLQNKKMEYHIEKELTTKTFTTLIEMQNFLKAFSSFNKDDIMDFLSEYQ